jgi:hypothetical protein
MTGVLLVMVFMPIGSNQFSANSRKGKFGKFLGALGNMILGALSGRECSLESDLHLFIYLLVRHSLPIY